MTVARLRVEMPSDELTQWIAYDRYEADRREREAKDARDRDAAAKRNVDTAGDDDEA